MRSRLVAVIATSITISGLTLSALAQGGAPAPAPAAPAAPAKPVAPPKASKDFGEADRSADAVKRGEAIFTASTKAYQAAPTLTESISVNVGMPGGESNKQDMKAAYGPKDSFRMTSPGVMIVAVDGMAYFVPDQPADKYVEKKIEGSLSATLGSLLPDFSMPTAALSMRDGVAVDKLATQLGSLFMQDTKIVGARTAGGADEVLLAGQGGEMVVSFDAATKLQKGMRATLMPPGAPEGFVVSIELDVTNTVADKLDPPITFERGARTSVPTVMDLMDSGGKSEPEMKLKVGDAAPSIPLMTIDGSEVNLASMTGKVIVLDFWATWCGPCRKGLPLLQKFADSMQSNDKVVVRPVNVWQDEKGADRTKKITDFWADQKFMMTTLVDPENKYIESYGFTGIPAFVIIGPDGKVAAMHVGFDANLVETLTKEVNAALGTK